MDTKKLLPRAGADPGFGEGSEFMACAERDTSYVGHLGALHQWCPVAKPLVGSVGEAP